MNVTVTRRNFLKTAKSAAAVALPVVGASGIQGLPAASPSQAQGVDLLRRPDSVRARLGASDLVNLEYATGAWNMSRGRVSAEPAQAGSRGELPIGVTNGGKDLRYLHIRWNGRESDGVLSIGDQWERRAQ